MNTYKAILRGNRLEWLGEAPNIRSSTPLNVSVTVYEQESPVAATEHGDAMAALLEKLAEHRAFASITDPIGWQRELRQERMLPERES